MKVGLSTDVTSPIRRRGRAQGRTPHREGEKAGHLPPADDPVSSTVRLDHGHLFNIKPASRQRGPLRLSRLPD